MSGEPEADATVATPLPKKPTVKRTPPTVFPTTNISVPPAETRKKAVPRRPPTSAIRTDVEPLESENTNESNEDNHSIDDASVKRTISSVGTKRQRTDPHDSSQMAAATSRDDTNGDADTMCVYYTADYVHDAVSPWGTVVFVAASSYAQARTSVENLLRSHKLPGTDFTLVPIPLTTKQCTHIEDETRESSQFEMLESIAEMTIKSYQDNHGVARNPEMNLYITTDCRTRNYPFQTVAFMVDVSKEAALGQLKKLLARRGMNRFTDINLEEVTIHRPFVKMCNEPVKRAMNVTRSQSKQPEPKRARTHTNVSFGLSPLMSGVDNYA